MANFLLSLLIRKLRTPTMLRTCIGKSTYGLRIVGRARVAPCSVQTSGLHYDPMPSVTKGLADNPGVNRSFGGGFFFSTAGKLTGPLDNVTYEQVCEETLVSLTEYFDALLEDCEIPDTDVSYGSGVLTVMLGKKIGTYVINKQTPNKQIWLSSPTSGPKRYDFIDGKWIYKHTGVSLHTLLTNEISAILKRETDFSKCAFGGSD